MNTTILWGLLAVIFFIIELIMPGLVSIWFAVGSIFALIYSLFDSSLILEITIFIVISISSMVLLKKFSKNKFYKNGEEFERIVGKIVKITEIDDSLNCRVYLDGKYWIVKVEGDLKADYLKVDDVVKVIGIEGNRLIVKKQIR
ncbi:MAG: NfeD family protein [Fusobacteriaceae bacterium]